MSAAAVTQAEVSAETIQIAKRLSAFVQVEVFNGCSFGGFSIIAAMGFVAADFAIQMRKTDDPTRCRDVMTGAFQDGYDLRMVIQNAKDAAEALKQPDEADGAA